MPRPLSHILIIIMLVNTCRSAAQEVGLASYYHDYFTGKKTASGENYDPNKFTAAHKSLPIGTMIKVTNLDNDKWVIVRVNDRGPYVKNRILDVSRAAAVQLGLVQSGFARVTYTVIDNTLEQLTDTSPSSAEEKFFTINEVDTATKMQYGVKVGSYEDPKYVFVISKELKSKFEVNAYIQNVKLIKGTLYRIFVGNFATLKEAEELAEKLKKLYPDCKAVKYESFK